MESSASFGSRASGSSQVYFEFQRKMRKPSKGEDEEFIEPVQQSFLEIVNDNKYVLLVITLLLAVTLVCSLIPVLRLPACAVQAFGIGIAGLKWDEGSVLPQAVNSREVLMDIRVTYLLWRYLLGSRLVYSGLQLSTLEALSPLVLAVNLPMSDRLGIDARARMLCRLCPTPQAFLPSQLGEQMHCMKQAGNAGGGEAEMVGRRGPTWPEKAGEGAPRG
eukprot:CAMPEP_0113669780 /NCGR_PEP_ID=MMETSP0038_2-20120614/4763_1 /TAXON_ID=2898 /ORGANISM="Cryptomonas paramecium" /LENGTH=218 /DNA_ID=CAMNT_0000585707 /DNA_START=1 /DNA_END=655 /DNA_ORIENTATION=- /assembly_acc=CAM_ASM_000170